MNTAKRRSSGWITLFSLLLAIALLPSCSAGLDGRPVQSGADLQRELEGRLLSELARLGKDPDRAVASAPQGSGNAVFNLTAEPNDPDGPGGQPPLSVELSWTARIVGDYDQNGEVGIADITPLGQFFKQSVAYDDPLRIGNVLLHSVPPAIKLVVQFGDNFRMLGRYVAILMGIALQVI